MVMEALAPWQSAWMTSKDNPYLFATQVLGLLPAGSPPQGDRPILEAWQDKFLREFFLDPAGNATISPRHSVRSGHGIGKTQVIATLALWFVSTHYDSKCVITASSQDQLRDGAWSELRKWHSTLPAPLREQIECGEERAVIKAAPEMGFIVRRTASKANPQALAGIHAAHVLYLVDEASGIEDVIFETAAGSLSTVGAMACMFSNPTKTSGFFYDSHHKMRDRWRTTAVSSEDVPRARGHIEDIIAMYGKDSNKFRVRVTGNFPTADDDVVIPLEWVESAVGRQVEKTHVLPVAGIDVARYGDDANCFALRQGNTLLMPPVEWRGVDLMSTVGRVARIIDDLPLEKQPSKLMVDSIGLGAGVADRLRELGYKVVDVNVSEAASIDDLYLRARDELWFRGRAWFEKKNVALPDGCDQLIAELTSPAYTFTSSGKIVVESKREMKKRGLASPNWADAFLLSLYEKDRQKVSTRPHQRNRAAWAA